MAVYKIFISSPGDVGRERHLAEQVIRRVAAEFQDRVEVRPYFWEYEPMESTLDYQENIPLTSDFDLGTRAANVGANLGRTARDLFASTVQFGQRLRRLGQKNPFLQMLMSSTAKLLHDARAAASLTL
jgi:hypothetical protein